MSYSLLFNDAGGQIANYFIIDDGPADVNKIHIILTSRMYNLKMCLVMRKPDFCICENKDADQLCGNREADQRLCFRYIDSTIPLLPKSEILSL